MTRTTRTREAANRLDVSPEPTAPTPLKQFMGQLRRDLTVVLRARSEFANPLMFYLMAIALFPFGIGTTAEVLSELAPGVLWVLALLSTLLSLDTLFRRDFDDGSLEQLVLHAEPLFLTVLAKVLAHWMVTGLPLTLLAPLVSLVLYLPAEALPTLMLSLLLGTPILSLLGAIGAGLTVGLRGGGLLLALLILPLYIPVLIFGAGATVAATIQLDPLPQLLWLSVILSLAVTLTPFATAAALKISLE